MVFLINLNKVSFRDFGNAANTIMCPTQQREIKIVLFNLLAQRLAF